MLNVVTGQVTPQNRFRPLPFTCGENISRPAVTAPRPARVSRRFVPLPVAQLAAFDSHYTPFVVRPRGCRYRPDLAGDASKFRIQRTNYRFLQQGDTVATLCKVHGGHTSRFPNQIWERISSLVTSSRSSPEVRQVKTRNEESAC
jgi:hypothetical protein